MKKCHFDIFFEDISDSKNEYGRGIHITIIIYFEMSSQLAV